MPNSMIIICSFIIIGLVVFGAYLTFNYIYKDIKKALCEMDSAFNKGKSKDD